MKAIVVFDGDCGLCNGFVAWLIRHDRDGRFLIAGSAGEVGREVIRRAKLPEDIGASTIVLWPAAVLASPDAVVQPKAAGAPDATVQAGALVRSDAVLAILSGLPLPWRAARIARIVPRSWRDWVYEAIASRRPRTEAEDPACGIPPAELVERWHARLATAADIT